MKKFACLVLVVCVAATLCGCSALTAIFGGGEIEKANTDTVNSFINSIINNVDSIPLPGSEEKTTVAENVTPSTISSTVTVSSSAKNVLVAPQSENLQEIVTVEANGGLNLRYGPSKTYDRIVLIPNGAKIIRTAQQDGWSYVNYSGTKGWVSSEFVK